MAAPLNPAYRRGEGIKWGLVSYTVVMFSVATAGTAISLNGQSISYIDNRKFPGIRGVTPPGPLGYQFFTNPEALSIISNVALLLGAWLVDGFLVGSLFGLCSHSQAADAGTSSCTVATLSTP